MKEGRHMDNNYHLVLFQQVPTSFNYGTPNWHVKNRWNSNSNELRMKIKVQHSCDKFVYAWSVVMACARKGTECITKFECHFVIGVFFSSYTVSFLSVEHRHWRRLANTLLIHFISVVRAVGSYSIKLFFCSWQKCAVEKWQKPRTTNSFSFTVLFWFFGTDFSLSHYDRSATHC